MKIRLLTWAAALGAALCVDSPAWAQRAEDSVVSATRKGSTSTEIGAPSGISYLLSGVHMKSWSRLDHVWYGPYRNLSNATLTIDVETTAGGDWPELSAWLNNNKLFTSQERVRFSVPAGAEYHFTVKDSSRITATADARNLTAKDVGLPSESDFMHPQGEYVKCFVQVVYDDPPYRVGKPIFVYKLGTMKDKSTRQDRFNRANPDFTLGYGTHSDESCDVINYFLYQVDE